MSATELNPDVQETRKNLTGVALASAQVTAFALAVQRHTVIPLEPEPDWYPRFKLDLALAQREADVWMTRLSPMMFSKVPQSIIDYGNLFDAAISEVMRVLAGMGDRDIPTPGERRVLTRIFGVLLDELKTQKGTIAQLATELGEFRRNVRGFRTAFETARQAADRDRTDSSILRQQLQRDIDSLQAQAAAASSKMTASVIGLGLSLLVLVGAIGFAIASGGAAVPVIVGVVAFIGVGAGIAGTVVFSREQSARLAEIQTKMAQLNAKDAIILALGQVASTIGRLTEQADKAIEGLGTLVNMWATLGTKLNSVINRVKSADTAEFTDTIEIFTNASKTAWDDLTSYALILQRAGEGTKIVEQNDFRQAA